MAATYPAYDPDDDDDDDADPRPPVAYGSAYDDDNNGDDDALLDEDAGDDDGRVAAKQPWYFRYAVAIALGTFVAVLVLVVGTGAIFYSVRGSLLRYNTTLILVSFDGFRAEYLQRGLTPNITAFGASGVRAQYMRPSFPSKTFPNHYTIVTGLYPEAHGIVSNTFFDPTFNETFSVGDSSKTSQAKWWGGEPFWNTVQKAGHKSACYYWPGSEAPIQDMRPYYYAPYNHVIPNRDRVDQVIEWLQKPFLKRPHFVTLYFSTVDDAGHMYGPNSPELDQALVEADDAFGYLLSQLDLAGLLNKVDIILVSDHGMTSTSQDNVRKIDDYVSLTNITVVDWSPITSIIAKPGVAEEDIFLELRQVAESQNFEVYWKNSPNASDWAPERFHYRNNVRITPISVVMDLGWSMSDINMYQINPGYYDGGNHGYDNVLENMQAIFLASGPSFRSGVTIDPFNNIEIYNLLAKIMNIAPAPNNGTANSTLLEQALRPPPTTLSTETPTPTPTIVARI